jgi:hypothetical protein
LDENYGDTENCRSLVKKSDSNEEDFHVELETEESCTAVWQFKDEDGEWKNFPKKVNLKIDTSYKKNKRSTVLINISDSW